VTSGKPIGVFLQSISGVSAINPLDTFYDIHGGKREVLFIYFVPDTIRDIDSFHTLTIQRVWYIGYVDQAETYMLKGPYKSYAEVRN
jgi:hypothetical protein